MRQAARDVQPSQAFTAQRLNQDFSQILMHRLQAKLSVSQPGDPYEQEADWVADRIMRMVTPEPERNLGQMVLQEGIQRKCAACEEEEDEPLRRKEGSDAQTTNEVPPIVSEVLQSSGQPLDDTTNTFMELRFGHDFSQVRVHTDARAAASAQAVNALAYTVGRDVVFGSGQYAPETTEGKRLLAHELTHVVQQNGANVAVAAASAGLIQRDSNPASSVPASAPQTHARPTTGETAKFAGVTLTENPDQLEEEMVKLVALGLPGYPVPPSIDAPDQFLHMVLISTPPMVCGEPKEPDYEDCHRREILKTKIGPVLAKVVQSLGEKHQKFLDDFTTQAKDNTRKTLDANQTETKKEAIRYGITEQQIEHITSLPGGVSDNPDAGGAVQLETRYDMDKESPAGKGLQAAAKVLLERRQEIMRLRSEREDHRHVVPRVVSYGSDVTVKDPDEKFYSLGQDIGTKEEAYKDLRGYLSGQFPVLEKFSDLDQDISGLQELVTKGPGPEMAALIAQKLADTLGKIATSRQGLDDGKVNVWRLPKIVSLTQAQLGLSADPVKAKLIEEKAKHEQPGMLEGIALLVLNLAALALAGPTGGLSLVVAMGVNALVAAEHVQEYMMQDALTGSALQKAKALSQDEPSLFWLAVEIVGVAFDAATATATMLKAFKTLAPVVRAAKVAEEGKDLEKSLQAVRDAAQDAKVGEKAESIIGKIKELRKGEDVALKAAGATEKEVEALKTAAKAGEIEATGEVIGGAAKTAEGKLTLTKNGHLYSCSSPCELLREKYAEVLAKNESFEKELLDLERRAKEASSEVANNSEQATKLAEQVKQDAAALDNKLRTTQIEQGIKALSSKYKILQDLGLDAAAVERVLAKKTVEHMKGQLLEELMASKVRKMLGEEAGRTALAGEKASAKLEFIEGHRITGAKGRQLTDGMIVIRDGDKVQVVTVLESKAGKAAARELRVSRQSRIELMGSEKAYNEARAEAIEELRRQRPELKGMSSNEIEAKYMAEVDDIFDELPRSEAGQMRLDMERLTNEKVLIDGQLVKVKAGPKSTQFVNALPSNVSGTAIENAAGNELLKASTMNLDIDQKQLKALAEDVAESLAAAK